MKSLLDKLGWILLIGVILSGCVSVRTVYVPPRTPVRLRQDIPNVKVWTADADKNWQESVLDLKEGWYVLSDEKAQ